MDFEQAKAEWLKKLNGKSLLECENEQDKEALKNAEALNNDPEYQKIWEEASDEDSKE